MIWAVQILRPYLEGKHFTVFTDHAALRWMFSLADATNRLARWRLRLLEFDFEIRYRKGAENTVADVISRLPTFGHTMVDPDLDIPCLCTEILAAAAPPLHITDFADVRSWSRNDWELAHDDHDEHLAQYRDLREAETEMQRTCGALIAPVEERVVSAITLDEIRSAQAEDKECMIMRQKLESESCPPYYEDERGIIVRKAPIDGVVQIFLTRSLRQRALFLAHHTPVAGHPGITRQFYTMRQQFFWPSMAADIRNVSRNCHACAKERVKLRSHQAPMKLFPATEPLEFVAIDILGPLPKAKDGSRYLLVMTDRFSKLTRAVPLKSISALKVAQAFVRHWVLAYGAPARLLSDNGSQFTSKLFQFICTELGIRNAFATTYHPQTNGQVERFNRTILAGLRAFVMDNAKTWPEFVGPLTYAYNTQVHPSLGVTPFQLVLSRPPGSAIIRQEPAYRDERKPKTYVEQFRQAIKELAAGASPRLRAAQNQCKRNFDKRVRPLHHADAGDWVYITREQPGRVDEDGLRGRHKLQTKAIGPFEVLTSNEHTVTTLRSDGLIEVITRDRTAVAPNSRLEQSPKTVNDHEEQPQRAPENDSDPTGVRNCKSNTYNGS